MANFDQQGVKPSGIKSLPQISYEMDTLNLGQRLWLGFHPQIKHSRHQTKEISDQGHQRSLSKLRSLSDFF